MKTKKQKPVEHRVGKKREPRKAVLIMQQAIDALEDLCKRRHLKGRNRIATAIEMLVLDEMVRYEMARCERANREREARARALARSSEN